MLAAQARRWQVMWAGNLFATFNYQGGLRGDDNEVRAQNWLMVMGSRPLGRGTLALSGMASLEPVTVGGAGYAHLFQLGETYRGANREFTAITIMAGRVTRTYTWTGALLAEGIHWIGSQAIYGRYEGLAVESEHLMFPTLVHPPHPGEFVDNLHAVTVGGVRRIAAARGIDLAIGGDATFYRVPARLQPTHGERPASAHIFLRIRPLRDAVPAEHHH